MKGKEMWEQEKGVQSKTKVQEKRKHKNKSLENKKMKHQKLVNKKGRGKE